MSLKIVIASRNPVKGQAVLRGFQQLFPDQSFELVAADAPSGVREQPVGDKETRLGASNRIAAIKKTHPDADYWAAIEGGVNNEEGQLSAYAWIVIADRKRTGWSRSASFYLPPKVAEYVHQGLELGEADDRVFGRSNSKQLNGAVGILTADAVDRAGLYTHAVLLALIPFINPDLYQTDTGT
ncbi:MAG: inosine/xanthosine triphosphatase [Leptolinea sp.]|nr:inosine/xanthosine triphosphatase [Leptolinea sp.]